MTDARFTLRRREGPERCAVCHADDGELETCAGCGTRIHLECRQDLPRCPMLGCLAGMKNPAERPLPTAFEAATRRLDAERERVAQLAVGLGNRLRPPEDVRGLRDAARRLRHTPRALPPPAYATCNFPSCNHTGNTHLQEPPFHCTIMGCNCYAFTVIGFCQCGHSASHHNWQDPGVCQAPMCGCDCFEEIRNPPGNIVVTNGSAIITGRGTRFTDFHPGQTVRFADRPDVRHTILSIESDTSLTLAQVYYGHSHQATGIVHESPQQEQHERDRALAHEAQAHEDERSRVWSLVMPRIAILAAVTIAMAVGVAFLLFFQMLVAMFHASH